MNCPICQQKLIAQVAQSTVSRVSLACVNRDKDSQYSEFSIVLDSLGELRTLSMYIDDYYVFAENVDNGSIRIYSFQYNLLLELDYFIDFLNFSKLEILNKINMFLAFG